MKNKILNFLLVLILIIMLFALTGCTNDDTQETSNQNISTTENVNTENKNQAVVGEIKTLTAENLQENVGEHIKWFYAAYLGADYGWNDIYEYKDVSEEVEIPGVEKNSVYIYELVGITSKKDIEDSLANYVSRDKFSKLSESGHVAYSGHFLGELTEHNGKVYWLNPGIGGGFYIKNPRIVSTDNEITKIKIDSYSALGETLDEIITLTFKYDVETQKFLIIDWEVERQY